MISGAAHRACPHSLIVEGIAFVVEHEMTAHASFRYASLSPHQGHAPDTPTTGASPYALRRKIRSVRLHHLTHSVLPLRPRNAESDHHNTLFLCSTNLCDELHNTTGLLDLSLGLLADVTCAHNNRHLGYSALSEHLCVAEGE